MLIRKHDDCEENFGVRDMICSECGNPTDVKIIFRGKNDLELCENCATYIARILFQDVVAYQNGCRDISLRGLMYHGKKYADGHPIPAKVHPNGHPVNGYV